jgi:microcystin-dependent protein
MAIQPVKWLIQIGLTAEKATIPISAGADQIDLSKLYPSAYELPLDAGGQAVGRTEMNALFATMAENIYFQQQGGVYGYSVSIDYTVGTRVLYNGEIYKCIRANGISSTVASPTNTGYWTRFVLLTDLNPLYNLVPTGVILPYGGSVAPSGFFMCDHSAYSRTTYAKLFAVIGTRYGAGDGSTTFNVPNLNNGSFPRGVAPSAVGTSYKASLPPLTASSNGAHTHTRGSMEIVGTFDADDFTNDATAPSVTGAFGYKRSSNRRDAQNGATKGYMMTFTASKGWTGATSSNGVHTHNVTNSAGVAMNGNTVLPQSVGVNYIIRI